MSRRFDTVLLARNMQAALVHLRAQQALVRILQLAGPQTFVQLEEYCAKPDSLMARDARMLNEHSLHRNLTALKKSGLVTFTARRRVVIWKLLGQVLPVSLPPCRKKTRRASEQTPRESWWTQTDREQFRERLARRWS